MENVIEGFLSNIHSGITDDELSRYIKKTIKPKIEEIVHKHFDDVTFSHPHTSVVPKAQVYRLYDPMKILIEIGDFKMGYDLKSGVNKDDIKIVDERVKKIIDEINRDVITCKLNTPDHFMEHNSKESPKVYYYYHVIRFTRADVVKRMNGKK